MPVKEEEEEGGRREVVVRLHFLGCALMVGKSEGTETHPRSFYLEMYDLIRMACGFECLLLMEGFHAEKIQAPGF